MAILKIERTNEYSNKFRDFAIFINGEKAGAIANGQTQQFELAPGTYNVFCKIDWCSSPEIKVDLSGNDTKTFKTSGFKYGSWLIPISIFLLVVLPFVVKRNPDLEWLYYLYIPIGILIIYYLTFGRKKYLTLQEV